MPGKQGGDKHPPDSLVENITLPKEGQIYRRDTKKKKGFTFIKVLETIPAENDSYGKARVRLAVWTPQSKKWVEDSYTREISLEAFLEKDNTYSYSFAYESEDDFYTAKNISPLDKPVRPIRAHEELGIGGIDAPIDQAEIDKWDEEENSEKEPLELTEEMKVQSGPEEVPEEPAEIPEPEVDPVVEPEGESQSENHESAERARLEEKLEKARRAFIEDDYLHSAKVTWIAKTLGLKTDIQREPIYKKEYEEALKALQQYEFEELRTGDTSLSKEETDIKITSHLLRYGYEEKALCYALGNEIQFEAEQKTWYGKVGEHIAQIGNGYRKLSWKKKLALAGGILGLSVVGGGVVAGVAGVAWATKRVAAGAAGYLATEEGINKIVDWQQKKAASKEIQSLLKGEKYDWDALRKVTEEKIASLDSDLQKRKTWSKTAKVGAFVAAIGLPTILSQSDWFSSEGSSEPATDTSATEKVTATDYTPEEAPLNVDAKVTGVSGPTNPSELPGTSDAAPAGAETATTITTPTFEAVTVTDADGAKGLWGIVEKQLPENLEGAEKNRVTASVQNLIQNKLNGLTDAQIQEQYGFSSGDINLIKSGEVIKLDALVSQSELDEIIKGKTVLSIDSGEIPSSPEATAPIEDAIGGEAIMETPKADVPSYINSEAIGFQNSPLSPEQQHWINIRNGQGTYADSNRFGGYDVSPQVEQIGYQDGDVLGESNQVYSYEESRYQDLPAEYRPNWRENMTLLREELLDINHTEFGPNYRPNNWTADNLWAQYKGNSMQDIIAFDNPRYDYDPRDNYLEWERTRSREIYLPPMHPEPRFDTGPDPYANYVMDTVDKEYRYNISSMQRAAVEQFGSVAMPIGRTENVQQYMSRIATLYTRARLENPDFRLNF